MKLSSNQRGTGIVELLLAVVILAAVGFTGWYVWHSKQTADEVLNQAATSTSATKTTSPSCSLMDGKKGTLYTAPAHIYTVCLPNGWNVAMTDGASAQGSALIGAAEGLTYNASKKAVVGHIGGGDGARAFAIFYNQGYAGMSTSGYTKTGEIKNGTTTGSVYYRVETKEDDGFLGSVAKGTKQYIYQFKDSKKTAEITYNIFPGDADNSVLVNNVAHTLRFID